MHVLDFLSPLCELVNEGVTDQIGNTEQYCFHFIDTVESVGCAGSFCFMGEDRVNATSYLWTFEAYDWFNQKPEVQVQKLIEAVNKIKDKAYPSTSFSRYRIVDGFYEDRILVDWTVI